MSKRDNDHDFIVFLFALFLVGGLLFPVAAANSAIDKEKPLWKRVLWTLGGLAVAGGIIAAAVFLFVG
jgi:hypothetical protein